MNKLTIIGRLTRDPDLRTTQDGTDVCGFTVAVNRRQRRDSQNQPEADFFRVSAWRQLGENCAKYLAKGKMVAVVGSVSVRTYQNAEGETRASLEVNADDVEFLTPKGETEGSGAYSAPAPVSAPSAETPAAGFTAVETDELPF